MSTPSILETFFADSDASIQGCLRCRGENAQLHIPLRMAFQPIVDAAHRTLFAYEALVRGANGEGAATVLSQVTESNRYHFDQTCRVLAIATAKRLGLTARLSINFLPNAVYEPASCICLTLAAAEKVGFDPTLLIFELTEEQKIENPDHVLRIITDYQARGFATAIDDFGAGYSGLNLLADYQPNLIKLDIGLVRGIDKNPVRQEIVAGIFDTAQRLGIATIAEGVETAEEYRWLRNLGITLFQGYLFAKPEVEALPQPNWQVVDETGA